MITIPLGMVGENDEISFEIETCVAQQGSPVAITARNPEQIDIFIDGMDGNIWSNAWNNGWSGWFTILS